MGGHMVQAIRLTVRVIFLALDARRDRIDRLGA